MSSIKWLRLKRICEDILKHKYTVQIHGSTSLSVSIRAAVSVEKHTADIAVNLSYAKNLTDVIDLLSHELTHIVLCTSDDKHDKFTETWAKIRNDITTKYNACK